MVPERRRDRTSRRLDESGHDSADHAAARRRRRPGIASASCCSIRARGAGPPSGNGLMFADGRPSRKSSNRRWRPDNRCFATAHRFYGGLPGGGREWVGGRAGDAPARCAATCSPTSRCCSSFARVGLRRARRRDGPRGHESGVDEGRFEAEGIGFIAGFGKIPQDGRGNPLASWLSKAIWTVVKPYEQIVGEAVAMRLSETRPRSVKQRTVESAH